MAKTLASASSDQTIRIWDLTDRRRPRQVKVLHGHPDMVWQLALASDHKTLISGGDRGEILTWDTSRKIREEETEIVLPVSAAEVCFSQDSQSVVTIDPEGQVLRWSGVAFQHRERCLELGTNLTNCQFLGDRSLAAVSRDGVVDVWGLPNGNRLYPSRRIEPGSVLGLMLDEQSVIYGTQDLQSRGYVLNKLNAASDEREVVKFLAHGSLPFLEQSRDGK